MSTNRRNTTLRDALIFAAVVALALLVAGFVIA